MCTSIAHNEYIYILFSKLQHWFYCLVNWMNSNLLLFIYSPIHQAHTHTKHTIQYNTTNTIFIDTRMLDSMFKINGNGQCASPWHSFYHLWDEAWFYTQKRKNNTKIIALEFWLVAKPFFRMAVRFVCAPQIIMIRLQFSMCRQTKKKRITENTKFSKIRVWIAIQK